MRLQKQMNAASLFHDVQPGVCAQLREHDLSEQTPGRTTTVRMPYGTTRAVPLHRFFRDHYRDEYTDEKLPKGWVEEAIQDELDYFNQKVWIAVPIADALNDKDAKLVGTRWVISNKQDRSNPDVRARLVAQEVAHHSDASFYSATPPLESKRMLFSEMGEKA